MIRDSSRFECFVRKAVGQGAYKNVWKSTETFDTNKEMHWARTCGRKGPVVRQLFNRNFYVDFMTMLLLLVVLGFREGRRWAGRNDGAIIIKTIHRYGFARKQLARTDDEVNIMENSIRKCMKEISIENSMIFSFVSFGFVLFVFIVAYFGQMTI